VIEEMPRERILASAWEEGHVQNKPISDAERRYSNLLKKLR